MVFMNDSVLDAAVNEVINNADRFDICSSEPATYTEATSTNTLGNETSLSFTGPVDGDTSGRKGTLDAITDGDVTGTGTASHYGISDTGNSVLYIANSLSSSQAVTNGNTFTTPGGIDFEFPDAVSE